MARNYEKNFGRLNRLWLKKGAAKPEKRPKLSSLKTSEEISNWLPSIKNELDFMLKQMEVPSYPERKIDECRKHIHYLESEYKAFVRKLHQLNSQLKTTPWTARPYEKKDGGERSTLDLHPVSTRLEATPFSPLQTPVLEHDSLYQEDDEEKALNYCDLPSNDSPLSKTLCRAEITHSSNEGGGAEGLPWSNCSMTVSSPEIPNDPARKENTLGLDYSSSDEDV